MSEDIGQVVDEIDAFVLKYGGGRENALSLLTLVELRRIADALEPQQERNVP